MSAEAAKKGFMTKIARKNMENKTATVLISL